MSRPRQCLFFSLAVLQNNAAQLLASLGFPVSLKSKAAFFVKKRRAVVPKEKEAIHELLIIGDMATRAIEQLAALVDEVHYWPGH